MVSFKGKLPENVNSFVMSAEVNEGISIPFKIILNVACSCQYSKRQCLSLINSPVIYRHFIKFSDTDDSRQGVRERRLEGIITSVTVKGTVKFDFTIPFKKDSNNYSLYEVVIEPALSTLAFTCNRKRLFFHPLRINCPAQYLNKSAMKSIRLLIRTMKKVLLTAMPDTLICQIHHFQILPI